MKDNVRVIWVLAVRGWEKSEWRMFIGKNKLSLEKYSVLFLWTSKAVEEEN